MWLQNKTLYSPVERWEVRWSFFVHKTLEHRASQQQCSFHLCSFHLCWTNEDEEAEDIKWLHIRLVRYSFQEAQIVMVWYFLEVIPVLLKVSSSCLMSNFTLSGFVFFSAPSWWVSPVSCESYLPCVFKSMCALISLPVLHVLFGGFFGLL